MLLIPTEEVEIVIGLPPHGKGHRFVVCVWDSRFHESGKLNNFDLEERVVRMLCGQDQDALMASELPDVVEMLAEFYASGENRHVWHAVESYTTVAVVEVSWKVAKSDEQEIATKTVNLALIKNEHILDVTVRLHNAQTGDAIGSPRSDTNRLGLAIDGFLAGALLEVAMLLNIAVDSRDPSKLNWPLPSVDSPP